MSQSIEDFTVQHGSMAAVKAGRSQRSSNTAMRVLAKLYRPGCGAQVSNPQAAIVSVTLVLLASVSALLAAVQQSSKRRISESACSNRVWTACHEREAVVLFNVLI
jgi:hypothetical protein